MSSSQNDIARAVICLSDHNAPESLKSSALKFLDQVKNDNDCWSSCMQIIMTSFEDQSSLTSERIQVIFWALESLRVFFREKVSLLIQNQHLQKVQNALFQWISQYGIQLDLPSLLKTKFAVVVATLFKFTYPEHWPQFFSQLFYFLQVGGEKSIDFFLRIMKSIDEEVIEKYINRTTSELDRNQIIKDNMRVSSIKEISQAFHFILGLKHKQLTNDCLEILGNYFDWAPIELFTTNEYINLYFDLIQHEDFKIKMCECYAKMALKGMKHHEEKLGFFQRLKYDKLLMNLNWNSEKDLNFAIAFSLLAKNTAIQILEAWVHFISTDQAKANASFQFQLMLQPVMLKLLSDESEEVSENIVQYFIDYINSLKKLPNYDLKFLKDLFNIIIQKCKYPLDFNFNVEEQNEYDVGFLEYRKELLNLYSTIARNCEHVKEWLSPFLNQAIQKCFEMHWTELEIVLTLFNYTIINRPNESNNTKNNFFPPAFYAIVKSKISSVKSPGVQYAFFDVFWRCSNYVSEYPDLIPTLLEIFVDERGMKNVFPMVKSRARYLFVNFTKVSQKELSASIFLVYEHVKDLMKIELITKPIDPQSTLTKEKYNLYEAIGSLLANQNAQPQQVETVLKNIFNPIIESISEILNKELYKNDTIEIPAFQNFISENIGAITYLSKNFPSDGKNPFICNALSFVFSILQQVIIKLPNSDIVRVQIAPFIRTTCNIISLQQIISDVFPLMKIYEDITTSPESTQEFIDLIQILPYKIKQAKNENISNSFRGMLDPLFSSLLSKLINYLTDLYWEKPIAEEFTSVLKLHKSFLLLLEAISMHGFSDIFFNDSGKFIVVLDKILLRTLKHPQAHIVKSALISLKNIVSNIKPENSSLIKLCVERIAPICFELPLRKSFDLDDASWYLTFGDVVELLKCIGTHSGDEFVRFSMNQILPSLGWNYEQANQIFVHLTNQNKIGSQKAIFQLYKMRKSLK